MAQQGLVVSVARVTDEGVESVEVRCDTGGGAIITADHFQPAGVDALPLPGDFAAIEDSTGTGAKQATGYHDGNNAGKSANGEHRIYGRNADGVVVSEFWLKGDGTVAITGLVNGGTATLDPSDGTWNFNGVKVDAQGNLTAPGEITAMVATAPVKLSTHLHPTGMGPSGAPTPGT